MNTAQFSGKIVLKFTYCTVTCQFRHIPIFCGPLNHHFNLKRKDRLWVNILIEEYMILITGGWRWLKQGLTDSWKEWEKVGRLTKVLAMNWCWWFFDFWNPEYVHLVMWQTRQSILVMRYKYPVFMAIRKRCCLVCGTGFV